MRLTALLSDAVSYAGRLAALAVVPFVTSLARWHDVVSTATERGYGVGVKLGFPYPLADLWTFVDPPSEGGGVNVHVPTVVDGSFIVNATTAAFVALVLGGLLMAGYVGSIHQYVESGRYDFLGNVAAYGVRMVGFQFVVLLGALAFFLPVVASPVLLAVVFPVLVVAAYLLYPTPYLVVIEDRRLLEAFERSVSLTTGGGDPLIFFVGYALVVAAASLPLSVLTNAGFPGLVGAAAVASGIGLVLTTFTVLFVRELLAEATDEGAGTAPA